MRLLSHITRHFLTISLLLLVVTIFFSQSSLGHVNYVLTPEERAKALRSNPLAGEMNVLAPEFFLLFGGLVAVQFLGLVLQDHSLATRISSVLRRWGNLGHPVMRITSGAFLLSSGLTGTYFAPQLGIPIGSLSPVSLLEMISGVSILLGVFTRAGALLFSILFFYMFVPFGIFGLDQLYLLGIAIYLFAKGGGHFSVDKIFGRIGSFPVPALIKDIPIHTILRTLFGLNLIWLGLTEKLLQPQLTAEAIIKFGVPYYPELGLFIFLFGFFEIYLGFHLVLGLFVRLTSLVYLGLLISAVKLFGETVNHLPLFGTSIFLLLLGAGEYYTAVRLRSVKKDLAADN